MNSHHVNSCHGKSYLSYEFFIYFLTTYFHNCMSNVWRGFESHQESQVLVFTKWCDDSTGVLSFAVKLTCIVLQTNVKFSEKLVPRTLAQNVRDYWQWILLTSFDFIQLTWVVDPAYSVVFLFESLQMDLRYWVRHIMHRLGIWINIKVYLFHVDIRQEFHQTSFCSPAALKASLLFDVHLDEWVLSWP